jgi:2-hydroxychromene-2-carboxylate isomerase
VPRTTLYLDLGSPYGYLACERAERALGEAPERAPILLGAIFKWRGWGSWVQTPTREDHFGEIQRRAALYGLPPLAWPDRWPWGGLAAMRAFTWAQNLGAGTEFAKAVYRRQFVEGGAVAEIDSLAELATAVGLPGEELAGAVGSPQIKQQLRRATEAAWAQGVRGVPTLAVGGELFYGDDRLEDAARRLWGVAPTPAVESGLDAEQAAEFASRWLPAWSGNEPERLLAFYAEDAFYADPEVPHGVSGADLRDHLRKLLAANPSWEWLHQGSIPMRDGFVNRWLASWPLRGRTVELRGICLVQLRDGLIYRNEVFFDRAPLQARPSPPATSR